MEIDVCPRCGSRYIQGRACSCQQPRPAVVLLAPSPRLPARIPPPARSRPSTPTYRIVLFTILGLLVFGIVAAAAMSHLQGGAAAGSRQGDTYVVLELFLPDPESSQALLGLIQSRPGFDRYGLFYRDPTGLPCTLEYVFSTDTVTYTFVSVDGRPASFTYQGHGIERLKREAAGGNLDD